MARKTIVLTYYYDTRKLLTKQHFSFFIDCDDIYFDRYDILEKYQRNFKNNFVGIEKEKTNICIRCIKTIVSNIYEYKHRFNEDTATTKKRFQGKNKS